METSGYSGTTLAKKLGIKPGYTLRLVNEPPYYFDLFTDLPGSLIIVNDTNTRKNLIHYFSVSASQLQQDLPNLRNEIEPNGIIWVSWPKKSSKTITDLSEDVIRKTALANGLVDIKVCAVDDTWSGLKLVIPIKARNR
jgi:hypothetical protein